MVLTDEHIIYIIIAFIAILFWKKLNVNDENDSDDGRIRDKYVEIETVKQVISENFKLQRSEKLKYGYTEKAIEQQLKLVFQEKFQHVVSQHGLDGPSGQKIDFDIGHGKVGVEIKLASSVFKAAGQDRMIGQIQSYIQSKYSDENLLLVIFCESEHLAERVIVKAIKDRLERMSVEVMFAQV